jgi:hypothetical protein
VLPEDGAPHGEDDKIRMAWVSNYTLSPNEFFEILIRYTHDGNEITLPVRVQATFWFVDEGLYLQADQETGRAYVWGVRVVRQTKDAEGNDAYLPLSPLSEEWVFYWR